MMTRLTSGVMIDTPIIRKSYQLQAVLENLDMTAETIFDSALTIIADWLKRKLSNIDEICTQLNNLRRSITYDSGGIVVNIIYNEDDKQWACRYTQPDSSVPARTWTTQISLFYKNEMLNIDILNLCSSPKSCDLPVPLTTPGFVEPLKSMIGLTVLIPLSTRPWIIHDISDIDELYGFISNPMRHLPVVVISSNNSSDGPVYFVDCNVFAQKVLSVAVIVVMNPIAADLWKEKVGRLWSVFDGAIRTYLPGVDFDEGDMYQHPLMRKQAIIQKQADTSKEDFLEWLYTITRMKNIQYSTDMSNLYLYSDVSQVFLETRRKRTEYIEMDLKETIEIYRQEVKDLERKLKDLQNQNKSLEDDKLMLSIELDEQNRTIYNMRTRIDELISCFNEKGQEIKGQISYPDNLGELSNWCNKHMPGLLVLSAKAKRAAKKSQFQNIPLIYQALEFLGNDYRNMRLNKITPEEYERKRNILGLHDDGASISKPRAGEQGDTYYFEYHGEKIFMEYHLRKGTSFNPKETLAIYFSWHEQSKQVLIGSLPGHLDTRISN